MKGYPIFYQDTPPIGEVVDYHGLKLTLEEVGEYPKRGGGTSKLLQWRAEDGRVATSGLRGKSVYWRSIADAVVAAGEAAQ